MAHYTASGEELAWRAGDVLQWVGEGSLKIRVARVYRLREAAGRVQLVS